jgi:hypothetical protein
VTQCQFSECKTLALFGTRFQPRSTIMATDPQRQRSHGTRTSWVQSASAMIFMSFEVPGNGQDVGSTSRVSPPYLIIFVDLEIDNSRQAVDDKTSFATVPQVWRRNRKILITQICPIPTSTAQYTETEAAESRICLLFNCTSTKTEGRYINLAYYHFLPIRDLRIEFRSNIDPAI